MQILLPWLLSNPNFDKEGADQRNNAKQVRWPVIFDSVFNLRKRRHFR